MSLVAVKDPEVLAQLEGGEKPVSDPALLAKLEGRESPVAANLRAIDQQRESESFTEPSTFEYLFNRIKKGAAGFMGLPGDMLKAARARPSAMVPVIGTSPLAPLVDAGMRAISPSEETVPTDRTIATSDTYRNAFGVDPNMKTSSDLLRYGGGVAEMAGAGGPFGLATKPAMLFPLASSIVGSGIGMEAGGDVASGLGVNRQAGEMAGSLVGGFATALAPNATVAAGSFLKNRFSPSANKARAESQAGQEIRTQLETYPPAAANIDRSLEISSEIPGFNPSLPARSNAPGLLAEERRLVSQSPTTLNKAVQNIEANDKAVADYVNAKFQPGTGDTAAERVKNLQRMHTDRLEAIRTQIDDKLDDATRVFETNPTNHENGQRLRELFFKQKEVYGGIKSKKYQDVYEAADRLGVKANIDDITKYADDVLANELNAYQASEIPPIFRQLASKTKGVPEDVAAFVEKHGGATGEVSFAKLHSLYKRANADIASLRGSSSVDRDFKLNLLEGLRTKLREKVAAFEEQGFGEVADKLKEANRFYAQEYLPRFKQGFGSDVAARYPSGEFRTLSDHIVDMIAKPRNVQGAKDFKLLFDEVPEAWDALRAGYLDKFYKNGAAIDKSGRINQKGLDTFLRQHSDTLEQFPQIKGELKQLALDNSALLERRAAIVAQEKKLAADDLYKLFQGRDPNAVLAEATTNPNAMRVLAFQARHDPNMAKSLARGVAEQVTMQPDPATYLAQNEKAIKVALQPMGEAHFKNLETAVEAMTINRRMVPPESVSAASITPDNIAAKLGSSPRAIISHILNVERGRTGVVQEGTAFLGRFFDKLRREHKAVALEAVFYDKDAAAAIARLAREPKSEKARMDFAAQMMSLGVRAEVAGQE